jgi:hypothetical protein
MSTAPQKMFVQIQEKISSFFREKILGILSLSVAGSVIAAYLVANGNQLWNAIKNVLPFILVLCFMGGAWWWDHRTLRVKLSEALLALENMSDTVIFDDVVLIQLARFVSVPPAERTEKLKEILQKLLENAVRAKVGYNGVFRASIFLPTVDRLHQLLSEASSAGGNTLTSQSASVSLPAITSNNHEAHDYIKIWASIGLDADIVRDAECYIGDNKEIQRGFAGVAFKATEPLVAHMLEQKGGTWICREYPRDYKQFEKYSDLRYRALAAAPIVTLGRTKRKTVGVICFDSMNATVFDSKEARKALVTVSTRIGAILSIYWQMVSTTSGSSLHQ